MKICPKTRHYMYNNDKKCRDKNFDIFLKDISCLYEMLFFLDELTKKEIWHGKIK